MVLNLIRRISVIALVGLCLYFGTQRLFGPGWANNNEAQLAAMNEVSIWENRFDTVRHSLPAGVDRVGYISDADLPNAVVSADQTNEFRLTRYVMAPVVVNMGVDYPWIIGNFSSNTGFKPWLTSKIGSSYKIESFSGGIYLIHKVQP